MSKPTRKRSDNFIYIHEDGGAKYIELWCYRQAEAEIEAMKLKIHNLENRPTPSTPAPPLDPLREAMNSQVEVWRVKLCKTPQDATRDRDQLIGQMKGMEKALALLAQPPSPPVADPLGEAETRIEELEGVVRYWGEVAMYLQSEVNAARNAGFVFGTPAESRETRTTSGPAFTPEAFEEMVKSGAGLTPQPAPAPVEALDLSDLREALSTYLTHGVDCSWLKDWENKCDCGLEKALTSLSKPHKHSFGIGLDNVIGDCECGLKHSDFPIKGENPQPKEPGV